MKIFCEYPERLLPIFRKRYNNSPTASATFMTSSALISSKTDEESPEIFDAIFRRSLSVGLADSFLKCFPLIALNFTSLMTSEPHETGSERVTVMGPFRGVDPAFFSTSSTSYLTSSADFPLNFAAISPSSVVTFPSPLKNASRKTITFPFASESVTVASFN